MKHYDQIKVFLPYKCHKKKLKNIATNAFYTNEEIKVFKLDFQELVILCLFFCLHFIVIFSLTKVQTSKE